MPTIRFGSLTCGTAQDPDGQDEAFLAFFVDGEYIGNVYRPMRSNTTQLLGFEIEYQNTLRLQLWEIDDPAAGNPHDFIGEINLDPDAQTGNAVAAFRRGLHSGLDDRGRPARGHHDRPARDHRAARSGNDE